MKTTAVKKSDGQVIWFNPQVLPQIEPSFFDLNWHRKHGQLRGGATGRGFAHFIRFEERELVLRPFRRGGLIGKINPDLYLRLGAKASRAYQEYSLLEWMLEHDLPVPRPVAARYVPVGLCYRADLVTERIPDSRPLADILVEKELPATVWAKIGAVICQMHTLGVHHSDLNCRNILLDADMRVWLIDFDKCSRREKDGWKVQNLARLKRSLDKELTKQPLLFWQESNWLELMAGYKAE
ncbi:3-deoxy-D-manno-octulosonic acid kinase [Lentibacter sp. XHP0401]|jgi:3-deoxy-D-manno-octulosonic acid kinase|uniref:3-deoxy-D-manno-octulosonic acid kinase n=1 Tax=Lentibacter sp. XHP0401 TaxID=2984334 RepID=UPI0021E93E4A|nr:3-deoxy-D-manno-octulosonic acid kinase [Lentibacter sp. XHP0401]MCV2892262.1 3-deoxy-D-manno-octulosonic acid kinase [Lentibacter sp. XHP0401]